MNSNLAQNIKRLRKENELTQVELAEKLGISKQSIISYEKATTFPTSDILEKMMEVFNVKPNELFSYMYLSKVEPTSLDKKIKELEIYKKYVLEEFENISEREGTEYEIPVYDPDGELLGFKTEYVSSSEQAKNFLIREISLKNASEEFLKKVFFMKIDEELKHLVIENSE